MFEVIEGGKLTSTCIAEGTPLPFIQCSLLNKHNKIDKVSRREQRNFTTSNPVVFDRVHRRVVRIQCVLDGGPAIRRKSAYGKVMVFCKCLFEFHSVSSILSWFDFLKGLFHPAFLSPVLYASYASNKDNIRTNRKKDNKKILQ